MMKCPSCDCELSSEEKPFVDLNNNTLVLDGETVPLTPREAELLYILVEAMPGGISRDDWTYKMYGVAEAPMYNSTCAYLGWLRAHIQDTRLRLQVSKRQNLRAVLLDQKP